jgi:hypothetical protein
MRVKIALDEGLSKAISGAELLHLDGMVVSVGSAWLMQELDRQQSGTQRQGPNRPRDPTGWRLGPAQGCPPPIS